MQESAVQTTSDTHRTYAESIIDRAPLADSTKNQYKKAVNRYLKTGNKLDNAHALSVWASSQPKTTQSFLKAAVRLVTEETVLLIKNGNFDNEMTIDDIRKALWKLEAAQSAIKPPPQKRLKESIWLSAKKVQALMSTCGDDIVGQRDWVILGLLVGAGLCREELVNLKFADIQGHITKNGKSRKVLNIKGKGTKDRAVPISTILAKRLADWQEVVGEGFIARSLGRKRKIGNSISAIGVFNIVRNHGIMIDKSELTPHDLRRTYAQLGFKAGVPITQISKLLGHATVATTQRYLDLKLDLEQTVSDFIPLG